MAIIRFPSSCLAITLGFSIAAAGCGNSNSPNAKKADGNAAQGGAAGPALAPAVPAAQRAKPKTADKPKKQAKDSPATSAAEMELGYGEEMYAVLPSSAPAGVPFAVNGPDRNANVDRFAFVPGDPDFDSTSFAAPRNSGNGEAAAERLSEILKDDSSTEYELPAGFTAIESTGTSASDLPWRIRCDTDGAVMALIPEGVGTQGSNSSASNVGPEHGVLLDAFYIDLREVTYARYEKFRDETSEKRRVPRPARPANDPQEPVLGVTWAEAHAFALWAGKALPTEAQWEKAARGPDGFTFPWGNGPYVWNRPRDPKQIDPVGSFRGDVSPYGVFDMAGNAREWCTDWYTEKYYSQLVADAGATARNPGGPKSSNGANMRVVKGGDPDWHVWARAGVVQSEHPNDVGFRCVLKLKPIKK